jgi:hypothetical protein
MIGIGIGIPFGRRGGIVQSFKSRVAADSGTFEAEACLNQTVARLRALGLYDQASLILTPNAYKAAKKYSIKPTNGTGDFTVARASTAWRRNASGVWESVANNVPRLHYPVGGGCPGWLNEPQRTNLIQRSQELDNAYWTKENATVQVNALGNLDKLVETATTGEHRFFASIVNTLATHTYSISAAAAERSILQIVPGGVNFSEGVNPFANFNLATGVVSSVTAGFTAWMENEGNGLWRCCLRATPITVGSLFFIVNIQTSPTAIRGASYAGVAGSGLFVGDMQLEVGAYNTSPIVTTNSALTRILDTFTLSGIFTNNFITSAGGTLLWSGRLPFNSRDSGEAIIQIANAGGTDFILIYGGVSSNNFVIGRAIGGSFTNVYFGPQAPNTYLRIAIRWDGTNINVWVNGTRVVTNSAFAPTNMNILSGGGRTVVNADPSILFPIPLTDSQCAALTT